MWLNFVSFMFRFVFVIVVEFQVSACFCYESQRDSSVDRLNLAKSGSKHVDRASKDSALVSVIERKMDEHFGNLLHGVEGLSARISQLETRLRRLENSVGDLKDSTEINHGKADGKLRQLENLLREVLWNYPFGRLSGQLGCIVV